MLIIFSKLDGKSHFINEISACRRTCKYLASENLTHSRISTVKQSKPKIYCQIIGKLEPKLNDSYQVCH